MNDARPPHLFQCMTREEFKTCWAIAFVSRCQGYEDAYDLERYCTPGQEGPTTDWVEIFKRVIRLLYLRHGYVFAGLLPLQDGEINAQLVEPRNIAFVYQFKSGAIPDPPSAMEMSLEDPQLQECGINLEPIRMALDDVLDDVKRMVDEHGKEAANLSLVHREAINLGRKIIDDTIEDREEFMRKKEIN